MALPEIDSWYPKPPYNIERSPYPGTSVSRGRTPQRDISSGSYSRNSSASSARSMIDERLEWASQERSRSNSRAPLPPASPYTERSRHCAGYDESPVAASDTPPPTHSEQPTSWHSGRSRHWVPLSRHVSEEPQDGAGYTKSPVTAYDTPLSQLLAKPPRPSFGGTVQVNPEKSCSWRETKSTYNIASCPDSLCRLVTENLSVLVERLLSGDCESFAFIELVQRGIANVLDTIAVRKAATLTHHDKFHPSIRRLNYFARLMKRSESKVASTFDAVTTITHDFRMLKIRYRQILAYERQQHKLYESSPVTTSESPTPAQIDHSTAALALPENSEDPDSVLNSITDDREILSKTNSPSEVTTELSTAAQENHGIVTTVDSGSQENPALIVSPTADDSEEPSETKSPSGFVCSVCQRRFTRRTTLNNHQRTHTGDRPFTCGFTACGLSFAQNNDRKRHEKTHSDQKPFRCGGCGKGFARKDGLLEHHHKTARGKRCLAKCKSQKELAEADHISVASSSDSLSGSADEASRPRGAKHRKTGAVC